VDSDVGAYGDPARAGQRATICTIEGTAGADGLNGTPGSDVICAYGGNDRLRSLERARRARS
jgi:Ca2+-binding RTX toxin-like protein